MKVKSDAPRTSGLSVLKPEDSFRFACHQGLDCFTRCCRDTAIFLTPYDILRMKNSLGISSESFLRDYTIWLSNDAGFPVVLMKMGDDSARSCPFVTAEGCRIYPHRPWACRIFPLQPEHAKPAEKADKQYYSVMDVSFCQGLLEQEVYTVAQWQEHQGIPIYREMEKIFKKITLNEFLSDQSIRNEQIRDMYYMACYDLDRFRRFVFESTFLKRFETEPAEVEKIKKDDVELYRFAMKWIEYGLIGQHVLTVKSEVMAAKKRELGIR